jgi:hypothetical protein
MAKTGRVTLTNVFGGEIEQNLGLVENVLYYDDFQYWHRGAPVGWKTVGNDFSGREMILWAYGLFLPRFDGLEKPVLAWKMENARNLQTNFITQRRIFYWNKFDSFKIKFTLKLSFEDANIIIPWSVSLGGKYIYKDTDGKWKFRTPSLGYINYETITLEGDGARRDETITAISIEVDFDPGVDPLANYIYVSLYAPYYTGSTRLVDVLYRECKVEVVPVTYEKIKKTNKTQYGQSTGKKIDVDLTYGDIPVYEKIYFGAGEIEKKLNQAVYRHGIYYKDGETLAGDDIMVLHRKWGAELLPYIWYIWRLIEQQNNKSEWMLTGNVKGHFNPIARVIGPNRIFMFNDVDFSLKYSEYNLTLLQIGETDNYLLFENGDIIEMEDGNKILIE